MAIETGKEKIIHHYFVQGQRNQPLCQIYAFGLTCQSLIADTL